MCDWVESSSRVTVRADWPTASWQQHQHLIDFVKSFVAPLKSSQVVYRFRYSNVPTLVTTLSINMPNVDSVIDAACSLVHTTLGFTPHREEPHEPYGNQIANLTKGVPYDGKDSEMREWYNRTWELDYRWAEAIVNSDVWKLTEPFGKDRHAWTDSFRLVIPDSHFSEWEGVDNNTSLAEQDVCAQRLHYLCNMLCLSVDWAALCTCPNAQSIFHGLNHAEGRIMSNHIDDHKALVEAFKESLEKWIEKLP